MNESHLRESSYSPCIIHPNGGCARLQRSNKQLFIRRLLVYFKYTFFNIYVQNDNWKLRINNVEFKFQNLYQLRVQLT